MMSLALVLTSLIITLVLVHGLFMMSLAVVHGPFIASLHHSFQVLSQHLQLLLLLHTRMQPQSVMEKLPFICDIILTFYAGHEYYSFYLHSFNFTVESSDIILEQIFVAYFYFPLISLRDD